MAILEKTVVTMKQEGVANSHARLDITVRDIQFCIDEPEARGGTNQGPSPTETLLASLLGCTNVITHKVAKKHQVDIRNMKIRLEAQFNRKGVILEEEVDIPFTHIKLFIDFSSNAESAQIDQMKADLRKFCAVSKVLRQAGTEIEEIWTVEKG